MAGGQLVTANFPRDEFGRSIRPQIVATYDPSTGQFGTAGGNTYTLATNITLGASATGTPVAGIQAGSYIFAYQFGGTTPSLILESLGPDGVNYQTITTVTASGTIGIVLGQNATVRLRNGAANPITGLSANLS